MAAATPAFRLPRTNEYSNIYRPKCQYQHEGFAKGNKDLISYAEPFGQAICLKKSDINSHHFVKHLQSTVRQFSVK